MMEDRKTAWFRVATKFPEGDYWGLGYVTECPGLVAFQSPELGWKLVHVDSGKYLPGRPLASEEEAIKEGSVYLEAVNGKGELDLETLKAIMEIRMELHSGNWPKPPEAEANMGGSSL